MIMVPLEALMQCEEEKCPHTLHVELCLLVTGGFGFKAPVGHGWQVLANPTHGPMAPFLTRCPDHKSALAQKKSALSLVAEH